MFPFFSKDTSIEVQALYRNGNSLAFACESLLEDHDQVTVKDREGHQAAVQIQNRRRADDRSWIYFAEVLSGDLEPDWAAPGYAWRQTARHAVGVRVRSPQLPEYSALTEDLSPDGAQLQTFGPLQVGDEIEIYLDLDNGFPSIRLLARVCWSRLTQPWRAGVAFLDLDAQQRNSLANFLGERSGESVLPGLVDHTADSTEVDASVLEKLAFWQSTTNVGDGLLLTLLTHDEVMEVRLPSSRVIGSNLTSRLVSRIVTQEAALGRTYTWLLDEEGATLAQIESGAPEIVCRGLRTHDLG